MKAVALIRHQRERAADRDGGALFLPRECAVRQLMAEFLPVMVMQIVLMLFMPG